MADTVLNFNDLLDLCGELSDININNINIELMEYTYILSAFIQVLKKFFKNFMNLAKVFSKVAD